jgi:hypothetical protein
MRLLGISGWSMAHSLLPLLVFTLTVSVSAADWVVVTIYGITVSHTHISGKTIAMLLLGVVATLWWFIPSNT